MTQQTRDRTGEDDIREYDRVQVRTLTADDLDAIVRIDRRITGHSRRDYLAIKLQEALRDTRIVVSLGADVDGHLAGFLMGRLYYGEFGVPEPVAILDTIGVDPERPREGIGTALLNQFKTNLRGVGIETIQTQMSWNRWDLLHFLEGHGFAPAPRVVLQARV
jgi:predicted N-acetyltransferase YhbS